jgi:hypothetical protein
MTADTRLHFFERFNSSKRSRSQRATGLMTVLLLTFLPALARAQDPQKHDTQRFDGKWATTVSCKTAKDAPASYVSFVTELRYGVLRGQQGAEGAPGYLRIDGKVTPAGVGHVYAKGLSVAGDSAGGRDIPAGTEYAYYIQARFERAAGSGNRVEGRACAFKFEKR